ncbi:response regulator [Rheinheimera muenzenbergensis]|uniref:Response regulator n=1 Tax=Rheinheimera muenzenbergensis TaxID=1193628 RepID=A0ABU8C4Y1_9GAMM
MMMELNTDDTSSPHKKSYSAMVVLVVDAAGSIRDIVKAILTEMGFSHIMAASNGEHALRILTEGIRVDLIISEAQMPKMDGISLLQRLRADKKYAMTPFIIISAAIEQASVLNAIRSGVSDYIAKPFSAKILSARIRRAIEQPVKAAKVIAPTTAGTDDSAVAKNTKQQSRILVVDDVADNIQLLSEILRPDYIVKAATNGATALKICATEPQPDLVLLDVMMPQMDGFEVCRRLKADPNTQHIAVIFLTAMDKTEDMVQGLELGAVDYITKPVNPPVVKARVNTHCRLLNDQKALRDQVDTLMENVHLKQKIERISQQDFSRPLSVIQAGLAIQLTPAANNLPAEVLAAQNACAELKSMLEPLIEPPS